MALTSQYDHDIQIRYEGYSNDIPIWKERYSNMTSTFQDDIMLFCYNQNACISLSVLALNKTMDSFNI